MSEIRLVDKGAFVAPLDKVRPKVDIDTPADPKDRRSA